MVKQGKSTNTAEIFQYKADMKSLKTYFSDGKSQITNVLLDARPQQKQTNICG